VYVVWQESMPTSNLRNYDILFKRSTDNGSTFEKEINLSNNTGFSEHPQLSSEDNNVIWTDDTKGIKQVYLRTSSDYGNSFGKEIKLSNNNSSSFNQDITALDNNVYAVWLEKAFSGRYRVLLAASVDYGNSFKNPITLSEDASAQSHPKISASNDYIYVVWNVDDYDENDKDQPDTIISKGGVFFITSSDNGATFGNTSKLNTEENGYGEAQVTSSGDEVYVIWGGSDYNKVSSLYFVKSDDNGRNFSAIKKITQIQQDKVNNPTNVEIAVDEHDKLFIAWQDTVGTAGDKYDILFAKSVNGGKSFQNATNIINNSDISECPSIVVNRGNIYITWEDLSPGNHEILYKQGYYPSSI
jgi:hypothetical protein